MGQATQAELHNEQRYFDRAATAREKARERLQSAHLAAGGNRATERAVRLESQRMAGELGGPDDPVAFGRMETAGGDTVYLGKRAILDESKDLLVMGWASPGAQPFYRAALDDPQGLTVKRQFTTKRNRVLTFEDLVFSEIAKRVDSLTEAAVQGIGDAVLQDLERDRTGEMRDIVQTIHASQYELVRSPLGQLLIVQGGPGTGKTAVALHQVAWLLANNQVRPDDVLVIGPNPTFSKYIGRVLPSLGENNIAHRDLRSLGPQRSSNREEHSDVMRLKGDARIAGLMRRALNQRIRFPGGSSTLQVAGAGQRGTLTRDRVEAELRARRSNPAPYAVRRNDFRAWIARTVGPRVSAATVDTTLERVWPSLNARTFLQELLASRDRLLAAAGEHFTAGEIQKLQRAAATRITEEEWSDSDVALLDFAEELINGSPQRYAHVVVDEGQDLTPMQLRSIKSRSRGSFTVVGDVAQSTGPWARDSWADVIAALYTDDVPVREEELSLGYRVPRQIFDLAAKLLPEAAPEITPPRVIRTGPSEPDIRHVDLNDCARQAVAAARDYAGRGRFVGVICPELLIDDLIEEFHAADVDFSDARDGSLSGSINLVAPRDAKGLEFDAVVVVEPEEIVNETEYGLRLLYIALTRTTRDLCIVHAGRVLPLKHTVADSPVVAALSETPASAEGIRAVVARGEASDEGNQPMTEPPPGSARRRLLPLEQQMLNALASPVAESMKTSIAAERLPHLLNEVRMNLGISLEEMLAVMADD